MRSLIREGTFGPFYCAGQEILRRLLVSVRDRNWLEVSPSEWHCSVDETQHTVRVEARHRSELVDFEWQGVLQGRADERAVSFDFQGEARRTMDICRLGLVVLHPVEAMLGARIEARGPAGAETFVVSSAIAPQPITNGIPAALREAFSSLTIQHPEWGLMSLQFRGDLFELEDQRNWGDASFKSYCTPLKLGFPRQILMGTRVAHGLDLNFVPARGAIAAPAKATPRRGAAGAFPKIGRAWCDFDTSESDNLDWAHMHIDVGLIKCPKELAWVFKDHAGGRLQIGVGTSEIAAVTRPPDDYLRPLASCLAEHRSRVARLLVHGAGTSPPSLAMLAGWREALEAAGAPDVAVFSATRGHFVDFNRSTGETARSADGIAFPLSPTVHANDPLTIAENVTTIIDIADTARRVVLARDLSIAPLSLHHPVWPGLPEASRELSAPWLAATLLSAAVAGIGSVTLASDVVSAVPKQTLGRLIRCSGLTVRYVIDDQQPGIHVAVLRVDDEEWILAINLNAAPGELNLGSMPRLSADRCMIESYCIRWLKYAT